MFVGVGGILLVEEHSNPPYEIREYYVIWFLCSRNTINPYQKYRTAVMWSQFSSSVFQRTFFKLPFQLLTVPLYFKSLYIA